MVAYYPDWTAGTAYEAGDRLVYNGDLYKVLQAHTAQETWLPGTGTESLYTRIDEKHDGTKYDPIPYSGNMTLEAGKYYIQSGKRTCATGIPATPCITRWRSWWGCMWKLPYKQIGGACYG